MIVIATIYTGYIIKTENAEFEVLGSMKARSGQKYICSDKAGRKITIDRADLMEAQKDGSATVLGASA